MGTFCRLLNKRCPIDGPESLVRMSGTKFKITIRRVVVEDYEMTLKGDSIMEAFDEARRLVEARNVTSNIGKFSVIKIKTEE